MMDAAQCPAPGGSYSAGLCRALGDGIFRFNQILCGFYVLQLASCARIYQQNISTP